MVQPLHAGRMRTPIASILMFVAASAFGALGQFLYKRGAETAGGGLASYLVNPRILAGIGCYTAVMVLFVAAFKRGGALSVLYPVYASTFIFAALISLYAFGTPIKPVNVFGMLLLVGGMYCMGR
jgi:multidrug transporter EmrE-like cation transporter